MFTLTIQHTSTGKQFVHMTRSGRRYVGATPEIAERKYLLAVTHMLAKKIGEDIAEEICAGLFLGITSFGDLTLPQLRELERTFKGSMQSFQQVESAQRIEPLLTDKQRRTLIKLGVYVLGPKYGKDFFWNKVKEWMPRWKNAGRVDLGKLTNQEADYLIRRFTKIERRLEAA